VEGLITRELPTLTKSPNRSCSDLRFTLTSPRIRGAVYRFDLFAPGLNHSYLGNQPIWWKREPWSGSFIPWQSTDVVAGGRAHHAGRRREVHSIAKSRDGDVFAYKNL